MAELEVDYDKNVTPLYKAISDADWDNAIAAAKEDPEQARTWVVRYHPNSNDIMWRFLPIHSATAKQPPENVINTLISTYRKGAQSCDDQGMLPLHYACGNQASIEIIRLLLLTHPEGTSMTDPQGMTPLHYLAQWGPSSVKALDVLLFANGDAAFSKDNEGCTPLDLAMYGDYPERDEVIAVLRKFQSEYSAPAERVPNNQRELEQQQRQQEALPFKEMVSIPEASDAVRRLQEAAAAQEKARHEFMRSEEALQEERDDVQSALGDLPRAANTFSSYKDDNLVMPSARPMPSREESHFRSVSGNDDAKQVVADLKAEVERLRTEAKKAEAAAEKTIAEERRKMQAALDEMKAHLAKTQDETKDSLSKLEDKEQQGQIVESRLLDKENDLNSAIKKNELLRKELDAIKNQISTYKRKTSKLDSHLSTLSKTMEGMVKEQEQIMKASIRHEQHMKKVALARQQKMQELIDQEVQFARLSLEKQQQNELGSEEMINEALEKQKSLMNAVQSVLTERNN